MQVPLLVAARAHLADFLAAYNFAKCLKTLCGLTPHEYVCKIWTENPGRFRLDQSITPQDLRASALKRKISDFIGFCSTMRP